MKHASITSRRDFLKTAASGLAGAALFVSGACSRRSHETPEKTGAIVRRTLGRTGLELPVVSMGSSYAINLVETALDRGMVYIHTSSGYSERNHERLLGQIFRGRPRESFVIATSPDLPYYYARGHDRSADVGRGADPALIAESIEGSLSRLGLDYVDIYYLCSAGNRESVLHESYMGAFEKLKQSGKTRFMGIGTHENEPEVIRAAAESNFWDVILTAYNFRQSHREDVRAAISQAAGAGLGVVAMKTQAGVYWDRTRTRKINMKAALKWVLEDTNVHTTIPAFSNVEELEENLMIMRDPALTPDERHDLGLEGRSNSPGLYCRQCGRCRPQCPAGMDVPTLMRSYMYAFGHGKPRKARDTLRNWTAADVACAACSTCMVTCKTGFDVRSRALEIAGILETPEKLPA